jgi:hypothetical protein
MHMPSTLRRAVAPSLIAAAAIVAVGSGTAVAAHHYVITSTKQIKPGVLKKLQKPGPAGAQGVQGAPGKDGAVAAYSVNGTVTTGTNQAGLNVVTKQLPAGSYVVHADLNVEGTKGGAQEGSAAICALHVGPGSQSRTFSAAYNARRDNTATGSLAFDLAVTSSSPMTAQVTCTDMSGPNGAQGGDLGTMTWLGALTAVQVATVS